MLPNEGQRFQEGGVLSGGFHSKQVQQPEKDGAIAGMNGPQQRQVIVLMISRNRFVSRLPGFRSAPVGQQPTDALPEGFIGRRFLGLMEHLAEHGDQRFLQFPVLLP